MFRGAFIIAIMFIALENIFYVFFATVIYIEYKDKVNDKVKSLKFKPYQLYDQAFIQNFPSSEGRDFYLTINRLTIIFNIIIVLTFILFLTIAFSGKNFN